LNILDENCKIEKFSLEFASVEIEHFTSGKLKLEAIDGDYDLAGYQKNFRGVKGKLSFKRDQVCRKKYKLIPTFFL
jgi:hypothetical protein